MSRASILTHDRVNNTERVIVAFVFGYESAAVASGVLPTITSVCSRHRWLATAVVLGLITHMVLADYAEVLRARAATPIE
jgi:hypothetical protein